ncbi:MAG TPA: hypothetical protein VKA46_43475 [Gemmataceae bacterium]|nr:hypothetical protein [Gemmataceae bacterium]
MISSRFYIWAVFLPALALSSAGCSGGRSPVEQPADVGPLQSQRNEAVDAQMDALSSALHQDEEQSPPLSGTDSRGGAPLSRDESESRLKQAAHDVEKGDLEEAWQLLTGAGFDLADPQPLEQLRAEVQAMRLHRGGATPLAARFAAHALRLDSRSVAAGVRSDLRSRRAWAWDYRGSTGLGKVPGASAESPEALFRLQAYVCENLPEDAGSVEREHFHFAFFLAQGGKYLGSYSLSSQQLLGGERAYVLKRLVGGRAEVCDVYDTLPSYSRVADDVKTRLEEE